MGQGFETVRYRGHTVHILFRGPGRPATYIIDRPRSSSIRRSIPTDINDTMMDVVRRIVKEHEGR